MTLPVFIWLIPWDAAGVASEANASPKANIVVLIVVIVETPSPSGVTMAEPFLYRLRINRLFLRVFSLLSKGFVSHSGTGVGD